MKAHLVWALSVVVAGCSARSAPEPRKDHDWTVNVAAQQLDAPSTFAFLRHDAPAAWNPLHGTWARVDRGLSLGATIGAAEVTLRTARWGRQGAFEGVPETKSVRVDRNRVVLDRGSLTEWYVNGPAGVEQGFVVGSRPEGAGKLALEVEARGASPFAVGGEVHLGRYRVRDLRAYDADHKPLPAVFVVEGDVIRLEVDDAGARYPIDIDPLYVSAQVKLGGTDSAASDRFGTSVAAAGNVVVVGAPGNSPAGKTGAGAVYVFVRSGTGTWSQTQLVASDGLAGDGFGTSVALTGSLLLVGAPTRLEGGVSSGVVYSFVGTAGVFGAQAKFMAASRANGDRFGDSVGLSANTAVVGAPTKGAGQAYAFERNTSTGVWAQQATLCNLSIPALPGDRCGESVAVSGNRAIVGQPGWDAGGGAIGNSGLATLHERVGTTWSPAGYLESPTRVAGDFAGESVAISGSSAFVGAPYRGSSAGAVFAWTRGTTGTWTAQTLSLAAPVGGDFFGGSMAVTGTMAVIGARSRDDATRTDVGAAYVYSFDGTTWALRDTLMPTAAIGGDRLGTSVAFSGEYWALGGPLHDEGTAVDRGVAYVMEFSSTKAGGSVCASSVECTSGVCADGFCCDRACGGCEACSAALKGSGANGVCGAVPVDTDPHGACAPDAGFPANCKADGNCNGAGICRSFAKAGTACGATTCTAGSVTGRTCSGSAASCVDATSSCGLYVCGASACKTTCAADADCAAGAYCTTTSTCAPKKALASACTAGRECASDFCVEGVCCNATCDGQCESCAVASAIGTCSPVTGAPVAGKAACAGAGTPCSGACDGKTGAACAYPVDKECSATCAGGLEILGRCDAKGACPTAEPRKCGGFACDGDVRCRTTCSDDTHCAKGYVCIAGACQPDVKKCNAAGTEVVDARGKSTPCAPYVCKGGACIEVCSSSDDCAKGSVCDAGKCVDPKAPPPPAAETGESGGCAMGPVRGSPAVLALALIGLARRRRRRTA